MPERHDVDGDGDAARRGARASDAALPFGMGADLGGSVSAGIAAAANRATRAHARAPRGGRHLPPDDVPQPAPNDASVERLLDDAQRLYKSLEE